MRTKLQKRKIGDYKIFNFFCKNVELYFFFVVAREGRREGSIMLSVFVDMFVFLLLCREERKGDSFNCTVFDLPANCTAKYTSPSAEFWTYVNSIFIGFYSINKGLNIIVLLGSDLYGGSQTLQTPLQVLLKQEQDKNCQSNVVGQEIDLTRNMIEVLILTLRRKFRPYRRPDSNSSSAIVICFWNRVFWSRSRYYWLYKNPSVKIWSNKFIQLVMINYSKLSGSL